MTRAGLAVLLSCFAAVAWAIVPPADEGEEEFGEHFSSPALRVEPTIDFYPEASEIPDRPELASFFARESGQWEIRLDIRNNRPHLIQGSGLALFPGRGNDLAPEDFGLEDGQSLEMVDVEELVRSFMAEDDVLGVDGFDLRLNEQASLQYGVDSHFWALQLQQFHQDVPVDGAHVFFRINNGNIVQFGANRVAEIYLDASPQIDREQAFEQVFNILELAEPAEILDAGSLEIHPVMGEWESVNERYEGEIGAGYGHRLMWRLQFRMAADADLFQVLIDAHSGELLEYKSLTAYATVKGDIYPTTNTDALVSVDFPFAEVSNGSTKITDANGDYNYSGGTATVQLDGRFVNINDGCGNLSLSNSSTGNLDLGGSGGTDCSTPGFGGAGNTHAARSGFYHLTNINRKAASFLPGNSWLNGTLTANMNINQTCNAFWNGSTVNFYRSGNGCANTGELAAVFLHEWGHGMDWNDGNGPATDKGTGEAVADTFAFLETRDACIGDNFDLGVACDNCNSTCSGVRDLAAFAQGGISTIARPNTVTSNSGIDCDRWSCPYSTAYGPYRGPMGYEGHCESYIASTATWDLAQSLVAEHGTEAGWDAMDSLWYGALTQTDSAYRVAFGGTCNPNAYVDGCVADNWYPVFMAVDDDDGNLSNGTPNGCQIWDAFDAHGIACGSRPPCQKEIAREIGSITYRDANQKDRIYAFARTQLDSKLSVHFWNGSKWQWANQGPNQSAAVFGKPAVITYQESPAPQRIYSFLRSHLSSLTVNYWNGSQWQWSDQGLPKGTTGPASAMVGSPGVITYREGTQPQRIYAFVRGETVIGSPAIDLFVRYRNASGWHWAKQGRPAGLSEVHGTPGVITYRDSSQFQRIYAFVRGSNGRLYVNYRNSSGWHWSHQGLPPGTSVSESAAVVTHRGGSQFKQLIYAFIRGANGRLYTRYWSGSQWLWDDRGKPVGTTVSGSPGAVSYQDGSDPAEIYVFVRGANGRLYMHSWEAAPWQWVDRGTPPGTTVAHGSTPEVSSYIDQNGVRRIYVFVQGADGKLYVNYRKNGQWYWSDRGMPAS